MRDFAIAAGLAAAAFGPAAAAPLGLYGIAVLIWHRRRRRPPPANHQYLHLIRRFGA